MILKKMMKTNVSRRKTLCLWGIIATTFLSSCVYINDEKWEDVGLPRMSSSELIEHYVMSQTLQYADILMLTYQLNEYLRQPVLDARDSVSSLYFNHVHVEEQKDMLSGKTYYDLTTNGLFQMQYQMSIFAQDDSTIRIEATARSSKGATSHDLTIDATDHQRWTVKVNLSYPDNKSYHYNLDHAFAVRSDNGKEALFTVEWNDSPTNGLSFKITGKAAMESVAEPRLYISYDIEKPVTMYYISDNALYPAPYINEESGHLKRDIYRLAYPVDGRITMEVLDPISGKTTKYVRDNLYYSSE